MLNRSCVGLSLALVALTLGCSSSSTPGAADARPSDSSPSDAGAPVTFSDFYTGVILAYKCLDCHVPGGVGVSTTGDSGETIPGGELDMSTPELAFENLVNKKAAGSKCGESGLIRVIPGDASASLILLKTELALTTQQAKKGVIKAPIPPPCGAEMPKGCSQPAVDGGLSCLFTGDIRTRTGWINGGAPGP